MTLFSRIEWPTVALAMAVNFIWFALAIAGENLHPVLWIALTGTVTALYWSLVHEIIHGHPTSNKWVNYAFVWLPIGWVYALGRFKHGHLQHHSTGELTDPFDDPESWYLAGRNWDTLSAPARMFLTFNNTLAGRLLIGPLVTFWRMIAGDALTIIRGGEQGREASIAWLAHVPGLALLAWLMANYSQVPFWQFAAAAYVGAALILIRTFLEHQAAEEFGERTVIIEDRGPLAFLFLFNNLHCVHHTRPGLAWYRLPGFYQRHRAAFIRRNNGYVYPSYWPIFRRYLFLAKEPVRHPFVA